jgi:urocanate hydratase
MREQLAPEFLERTVDGARTALRLSFPSDRQLYTARPIDEYKGHCIEGKAFQVMIDNNLDFEVALYPYELVTYGETDRCVRNWMQYRLIKTLPGNSRRRSRPWCLNPGIRSLVCFVSPTRRDSHARTP